MVNTAQDLGRMLGDIVTRVTTLEGNVYPDDPSAKLQLVVSDSLRVSDSGSVVFRFFSSSAFVVDHPVYGDVDSSILALDGGYSNGPIFSVAIPPSSYLASGGDPNWFAQTFSLTSSTAVTSLGAYLWVFGAPTGTVYFRVETVSGGLPTGTLVDPSLSISLEASDITGSGLYGNSINSLVNLPPSTDYAFVIRSVYNDASNFVFVGMDTSQPYTGGGMYKSINSGSTWSSIAADMSVELGLGDYTYQSW